MVGRKLFVVFLYLTFLAPIVLYAGRIQEGSISILKGAFVEEASSRISDNEVGGMGAVSQEVPYISDSIEWVKTFADLDDGLTPVEKQELSPWKFEDCKRRILSKAVDEYKPEQVTNIEEKKHSEDTVLEKENNKLDKKLEQGLPNDDLAKWRQFAVSNVKGVRAAYPDEKIRQLKDQLIRANAYLNLSSTKSNPPFIMVLRARVRDVQRILGNATRDEELSNGSSGKLKEMEHILVKGKKINDDCSVVITKLQATVKSSELQLQAHQKQTQCLTQVASKTLPKGLHCLSLRLSIQYYSLNTKRQQFPNQKKLEDPNLYHYALFSDNVLAAAVVVNSTVTNAQNANRLLWKLGTLPPGLITFYNRVFSLNRSWHVLGLGYNSNVNIKQIEQAAVIHYNGNKKPWLEIGMRKYRSFWSRFVDNDLIYLQECNISP